MGMDVMHHIKGFGFAAVFLAALAGMLIIFGAVLRIIVELVLMGANVAEYGLGL